MSKYLSPGLKMVWWVGKVLKVDECLAFACIGARESSRDGEDEYALVAVQRKLFNRPLPFCWFRSLKVAPNFLDADKVALMVPSDENFSRVREATRRGCGRRVAQS